MAKENKYLESLLKGLNKTEAEVQREKLTVYIEDSIVECEEQIGLLESDIKRASNSLNRAEKDVVKAVKEIAVAENTVARNFKEFVDHLTYVEIKLVSAKDVVAASQKQLNYLNTELTKYNRILSIFKGE